MLVIVLVRNGNYGRSGNRETQVKRYLKAKRKSSRAVYQVNCKQKGYYLEMLCRGKSRNVMYLRLQRE